MREVIRFAFLLVPVLLGTHTLNLSHFLKAPSSGAVESSQTGRRVVNGELDGSPAHYANAAAAIAAACSSPSPAIHFPTGTYVLNATTGGLAVCSGLHIRCDTKSIVAGSSATVFRLAAGAAIWGLYNPQADKTTGTLATNGVTDLQVDGCTFDISQDPQALGALRIKGIGSFQFRGTDVVSNNNQNPGITLDGANYSKNNGDYNGEFYSLNMLDLSSSSRAIGILITDSSSTGACSNDDKFIGGSSAGYKYPFKIDCGNNNVLAYMDLENWASGGIAIWLTTQASGGGAATGNHIDYVRMETGLRNVTGIEQDRGTYDNTFNSPYYSGSFTYFTPLTNNFNSCWHCLVGTAGSGAYYASWVSTTAAHGFESFGIGKIPVPPSSSAVEDVNGDLQFSNSLYAAATSAIFYQKSSIFGNVPWYRYTSGGGSLARTDLLQFGVPGDFQLTNGSGTERFGCIGSLSGCRFDGYLLPKASCGAACELGTPANPWHGAYVNNLSMSGGHTFMRHTIITASLSPATVEANTCAAQSFTVAGINAGDIVVNGAGVKPSFQTGLNIAGVLVVAANTVSINFCDVTSGSITPNQTETYKFDVEQ